MADEVLIDGAALERLSEWGGENLKLKMIELFFENGRERMDGVRAGFESGDLELAERSAHSLKSAAANLGGERVRALSARIEELLEGGQRDAAAELVPELGRSFEEMLAALNPMLEGAGE
jgi:two-component system, sensor histidine kinase and response regulator